MSQAALCYLRAWRLTAAALAPLQGARRHGCPMAQYSFALAAKCSPCLGGATGVKRRHALPKLSVGTSREEGVLLPRVACGSSSVVGAGLQMRRQRSSLTQAAPPSRAEPSPGRGWSGVVPAGLGVQPARLK